MFFRPQTASARASTRNRLLWPCRTAALAAALGSLALLPAPGLASNTLKAGVGGTTIEVNGTTISTSNLTLSQLAALQGVPQSTVQLELEGLATGLPQAEAIDALVAGLPLDTSLASALEQISAASGGAISPPAALTSIIDGQPGAPGSNGAASPGTQGPSGGPGGPGVANAGGHAKRKLTLRLSSRSLKGHPRSRVRIRFTVSAPATVTFKGRGLKKGTRKAREGGNLLLVTLPARHGNYRLALEATAEGQSTQAAVALHDVVVRSATRRRR